MEQAAAPYRNVLGKKLSWLYLLLSLVMGSFWLAYGGGMHAPHSQELFIRSAMFTPYYSDGMITDSIVRVSGAMRRDSSILAKRNLPRFRKDSTSTSPYFFQEAFGGFRKYYHVPLNPDVTRRINRAAPPAAHLSSDYYSWAAFLPQILFEHVAFYLELRPVYVIYGAAASALLVGSIIGFLVLRLIPCMQWPVFTLMLLPSVFTTLLAFYADGVANFSTILFFALLVRALALEKRISLGEYAGLFLGGALMSGAKLVYFPLLLSLLVIPSRRFGHPSLKYLFFLFVLLSGIALSSLGVKGGMQKDRYRFDPVPSLTQAIKTAPWLTGEDSTLRRIDQKDQRRMGRYYNQDRPLTVREYKFHLIIHDPFYFPQRIWNLYTSYYWVHEYLGNGWWWKIYQTKKPAFLEMRDTTIDLFFILIFLSVLSWAVVSPSGPLVAEQGLLAPRMFGLWGRLFLSMVVLMAIVMVHFALYVLMVPVSYITGVQGRYFLPILPFFLLLFVVHFRLPSLPGRLVRLLVAAVALTGLVLVHCTVIAPYRGAYIDLYPAIKGYVSSPGNTHEP